jgi:hypothetical protein
METRAVSNTAHGDKGRFYKSSVEKSVHYGSLMQGPLNSLHRQGRWDVFLYTVYEWSQGTLLLGHLPPPTV